MRPLLSHAPIGETLAAARCAEEPHGAGSFGNKKVLRQMSEDFFKNRLLGGVNRDLLTILAQTLETDNTVSLGKEGIVGADTHVLAGVNVRAALTHQNVAGQNELTVSTLGAKALGLGVTAVLGGAHTFFMGEELQTDIQHNSVPSFLIR